MDHISVLFNCMDYLKVLQVSIRHLDADLATFYGGESLSSEVRFGWDTVFICLNFGRVDFG